MRGEKFGWGMTCNKGPLDVNWRQFIVSTQPGYPFLPSLSVSVDVHNRYKHLWLYMWLEDMIYYCILYDLVHLKHF